MRMPDGATLPAILEVERSFGGRRWQARTTGGPEADERMGMALAQRLGLPEIVGRLLANRGVTPETAGEFLEPSLKTALPDPSHLKDMDAAVARIVAALEGEEPMAVFGDYDVDGATSAAILHRYFAALGVPLRLYVPDRIAEGYGPNTDALLRLHGEGIRLVLTVDCGISAHEPLAAAQAAGLDVVVLDHHVAEPALPPAVAVVNPNRLDEESPHKTLAAVGVTFLLLIALNRALRERGRFADRPEPDLIALLDLVALGTVCDVVPLQGLNRVLVAQGLKVMARRRNTGLAALADVARMASAPGAYHAGFLLGPRVNAGGRVGRADLGARLLTTEESGRGPAAGRRARPLQQGAQDHRTGRARRGPGRSGGAGGRGPAAHPRRRGGLARRRHRHRRVPHRRTDQPAGLRGRDRGRDRQGLRPLDRRGRSGRGRHRGAPGRPAGQRRRP